MTDPQKVFTETATGGDDMDAMVAGSTTTNGSEAFRATAL